MITLLLLCEMNARGNFILQSQIICPPPPQPPFQEAEFITADGKYVTAVQL